MICRGEHSPAHPLKTNGGIIAMSEDTAKRDLAKWGKRSTTRLEDVFLEGPKTRRFEFLRTLRILRECMQGFSAFRHIGPCITVFGSARFEENTPYYDLARDVEFRPRTPLEEGVAKFVAWYRQYHQLPVA